MSAPVAKTEPAAEEQAQQVEVKQETPEASEETSEEVQQKANGDGSATMEVDSAQKESNPESAATDEDAKPQEKANGDGSAAMEVDSSQKESNPESADAGEEAKPFRRNGASRKRFKWLMDQGYSRSAAAEISKTPFKPKEMREKFIAETGFFKEKVEKVLKEDEWDNLDDQTKRRVKWLLKNGYNEKEALRLATETGRNKSKRNLPANGNPLKRSAEAAELLVMAIVAEEYPKTFLTNAQTDELKSAILKEVVQQKDSEQKPHFKNSEHFNGYLRVQCSDQETRRWLQRTVEKLPAPEGISLKVIAEKNILKGDVYTGHFPDSRNDPNETILEFIESQNEGFDISKWTVLNRNEVRDTQTIELKFTVDKQSAKKIHNLGYELNYKFNTVKIRKQNPSGKPTDRVVPRSNQRSFNQLSRPFNMPQNRGGYNRFNQFNGRPNPYGGFNNNRSMPNNNNGPFINNNRSMSNNNNGPFNFVDTLYDQLRLISGGGDNNSRNNYNQWGGGNTGFNSNGPRRNYNPQGNRNFSSRFGFY